MAKAKADPDEIRKMCRERGMSDEDTEMQVLIMQNGWFSMSLRD